MFRNFYGKSPRERGRRSPLVSHIIIRVRCWVTASTDKERVGKKELCVKLKIQNGSSEVNAKRASQVKDNTVITKNARNKGK